MGEGKWVDISLKPGSLASDEFESNFKHYADKFSILKTDLKENAHKIEEIWRRWLCLQAWREKNSQTGISEVAKVNSLCISLLEYLYLLMGKKYISLENSVERLFSNGSKMTSKYGKNTFWHLWDIIV